MEIKTDDHESLETLIQTIEKFSKYFRASKDQDYKAFFQPIIFRQPSCVEVWDRQLSKNPEGFHAIDPKSLEHDIGKYDRDILWYINDILSFWKPLLFHHPLDWQLIAMTHQENALEDKIYVNVNKKSRLFGFYVYAPGGDDLKKYTYQIVATSDADFEELWKKGKILSSLRKKYTSLLDDYFTCSTKERIKKKKEVCALLGLEVDESTCVNLNLSMTACGVCFWLKIMVGDELLLGGDLFFDRRKNKFVAFGKYENFKTWEEAAQEIKNVI